jgi:hypothetical protein
VSPSSLVSRIFPSKATGDAVKRSRYRNASAFVDYLSSLRFETRDDSAVRQLSGCL